MNQTFMKERPVLPLILSMSLPMMLSMMVSSLYNIVDSFFVARISEEAMTAISLVFPVQNLINAVTIGFSIGINAVIAFYLGAQENTKANIAATQGVVLSVLHGILLTVGCTGVMPLFLRMFTPDEKTIGMGLRYSRIAFGFSVVIALAMTAEKIFQAVGRMTMTMVSMLCGCITNIILDPVLIFGVGVFPEMGIEGAALATGIGQVVSLLIYIVFYIVRPFPVRIGLKYLSFQKKMVKKLYSVGIPAALNLALPSLLVSSLNVILSSYSQAYVLVLGVYYKLQTFIYLTSNGIVQGLRPLIGYNYGAREYGRVRKLYRTAMALAAAIMLLGTILCQIIPARLIGLFTANPETIQIGAEALRIISLGFIVSSISVISSGALEGLGMGTPSLAISLLRYTIVIIPAAFILSRLFGAIGVWHAFWVSELLTAMAARLIYRRAVVSEASE